MKKRILAVLLAAAIMICSLPMAVFAEADFSARAIEFKDVEGISLFKSTENNVEEITECTVSDLQENLDSYLVKVDLKNEPDFYAPIKAYTTDNDILTLTLDFDFDVVSYKGNVASDSMDIAFGGITDGIAKQSSFTALIRQMNADPSGTYTLYSDLDASEMTTSAAAYVTSTFTGTLNGNGYTIKNLSKPLINITGAGAVIKNLIIADVNLSGALAAVVSQAVGAQISNVHVRDFVLKNGPQKTGSIVGILSENTTIDGCSAINFDITSGSVRTGGLVGCTYGGRISNSYAIGTINSTSTYNGGISGSCENGTVIENCIADVMMNVSTGPLTNGGLVGHSFNSTTVRNCLSLSKGQRSYALWGCTTGITSSNCYALTGTELLTNNAGTVALEDINEAFYADTLGFDPEVWKLSSMIALNNSDPGIIEKVQPQHNVYIPDFARISKLSSFDANNEIAYANMYKLMPFYDAKYLVVDGNKLDADSVFNTKVVKIVIPLDLAGGIVSYITASTVDKIKTVKVVFEDGTYSDFSVTPKRTDGFIAGYSVDGQSFDYMFNRYITAENEALTADLYQYASSLDYEADLDPLTEAADGRLYRDNYNEKTATMLNKIIAEILSQSDKSRFNIDNPVLKNKIESDLILNGGIKRILYSYSYYVRWYSFNIGTIKTLDILLSKGDLFKNTMTFDNVIDLVLAPNAAIGTRTTYAFHATNFYQFTGFGNVCVFIEYLVSLFTDYETADDWFTETYPGIVYEVGVDDKPDIKYRAWANLKVRNHTLLPILNLPANSAYIISMPTQIIFGAQNTYIRNPEDPAQHDALVAKVKANADIMKSFYETASNFVDTSRWTFVNINYDQRFAYDSSGSKTCQNAGTTESPFHKWFIEPLGTWGANNGSAAYANGTDIYWTAYSALSSISTWSHETGHNQDSRVFMNGKGRRAGGGAEDYADGNTAQGFGDGAMNFNLTYSFAKTSDVTSNLTPERINSKEKIYSYYKGMFESLDYLDYAEAKAFLRLTPKQQAAVAVQVYYPNVSEEYQERGDSITGLRVLTEEDFAAMNLQTIEDIWNNHITIYPGVTGVSSIATNKYGGASIYNRHWYQQHNDAGRPDSYAFKQLAWEMLGIGGYDNGYIAYYSGMNKNDLAALRYIINATNPSWATVSADEYTWKQYKLDRYGYIESKWDDIEYINSDKLVDSYYDALVKDAASGNRSVPNSTNVRRMNYHFLKRVTDDFVEEVLEPEVAIHISTADQLVSMLNENPTGNYVLDNDIDLSAVTGSEAVITTTFMGKLNGNGHSLYGTDLYIFNALKHAYIVDTTISQTKRVSIAKTVTLSEQNGVVVDTTKTPIYTIEDFLLMNNKPTEMFILMNDIDFSGYTPSGDSLITSTFTGTLLGNGYTLRGLNSAGLFAQLNGTVNDMTIENFTNIKNNGDCVNALTKFSNNANISNITFKNITLSGKYRTAVVSGTDNANSVFENIKVLDSSVTGAAAGVYNSLFVGRKYGGVIRNVYVDGDLRVSATENGAIVGATHNGVVLENVVSKATVYMGANTDGSGRKLNAGIVGNSYNALTVKNAIYIGQVFGDTYSFTGTSNLPAFSNCFELADNGGISSINGNNISEIHPEDLTGEFYTISFGFDESFWPFERMTVNAVSNDMFVTYRNYYSAYVNSLHRANESAEVTQLIDSAKAQLDALVYDEEQTLAAGKASVDAIVEPLQRQLDEINLEAHKIYSAQDFITKIPADLAGTFHIVNDIDFTDIHPTSNALITGTFTGRILGGMHTLSNLTGAALFAQFNGTASEMCIENFRNIAPGTDSVAAFAKQTYRSTITDIFFKDITLSGRHNVSVLTGMDGRENANSVFARISVINANVTGTGFYCSTLIGRKFGGSLTDAYVDGTLTVSTTENAGVIGASQQTVTMRNIVSNVNITMLANTDAGGRKLNGGIVGNTYNNPAISNSVYIGGVTGDTYRFTGSSARNYFTNCYELAGDGGISAVNGENIRAITRAELTKAFYTDVLGFDSSVWSFATVAETGHPMLIRPDILPGDYSRVEELLDEVLPDNELQLFFTPETVATLKAVIAELDMTCTSERVVKLFQTFLTN